MTLSHEFQNLLKPVLGIDIHDPLTFPDTFLSEDRAPLALGHSAPYPVWYALVQCVVTALEHVDATLASRPYLGKPLGKLDIGIWEHEVRIDVSAFSFGKIWDNLVQGFC